MHLFRLHLLIWLPVFLVLPGCRKNRLDRASDIAVIDVISRLGKYEAIPVSRFVTELEYIPLETRNDCLINTEHIIRIFATSTHIFIAGYNPTYCYVFDRAGRFVGKIGSIGQGPGEYTYLIGLSINEKNQTLYLETTRTVLEYSWDGVFRKSITKPKNMSNNPIDAVSFVYDNLFIGHFINHSGKEKYNFCLFDTTGRVVKSFDNHIILDRTRIRYTGGDAAMKPFRLSENMYVKEIANDTLYCLNKKAELVPQFVFNIGKYAVKKEKRGDMIDPKDFELNGTIEIPHATLPMVGIPNYIFFNINPFNIPDLYNSFPQGRSHSEIIMGNIHNFPDHRTPGIYDIARQQTQLLDTDPVSHMCGLINDWDGGLSFWPRYYTSDNEFIDMWDSYDMKEILTEEYFAAHEIKNPQAHQKLRELLKNLRDDDNPVIVIARLK